MLLSRYHLSLLKPKSDSAWPDQQLVIWYCCFAIVVIVVAVVISVNFTTDGYDEQEEMAPFSWQQSLLL
ncbi:putative disulfide bond formation protein [Trichinella spiralis]|uniref:Disulfide bond formation protein n=1 Tax=Trichinella spiralis TaxID=6334 RepID=A0ABR3K295_TRISP